MKMKKIILVLIFAVFAKCAVSQIKDTLYAPISINEIPDSLAPPSRLVWQGENGVFLNQQQELKTLEKLKLKEMYAQDAVTLWFVSMQLQDRVKDLEAQNTECRAALRKTEDESLANNTKLAESNLRLKDEQAANAILRDEKKALEVKLFKTRVVTVSLGLGLVGYYIITH